MDCDMERLFATHRGTTAGFYAGHNYVGHPPGLGRSENGGQTWSPAVDLVETADTIVLHAELPGMKKEESQLLLSREALSISGERACVPCTGGESFHRLERRYGRFARSFHIEVEIEANKVEAIYADGVLTMRLPKVQAAKPRQIEIASS